MQILINIALVVIGVLLFIFIIFAHELGHFLTAKKSGVQVNEFALGMGPKLFSFQKGETKYSLRLFPIGGYCAMEGEDESSDNPRAFTNAKVWKRMIIIVAGATMNGDRITSVGGYSVANSRDLLLGIQLLPCEEVDPQSLTVYKQDCCTEGLRYLYTMRDELKLIDDDTANALYRDVLAPAAQSINKAQTKDEAYTLLCRAVDGYYTAAQAEKPKDFSYPTIEARDKRLRYVGDVSVIRNGEKTELPDVQFYTYKKSEDQTAVGIDFYLDPKDKNFFTVMEETFTGTVSLAKSVWKSFEMLVQGRFHLSDMSGPVGITKAVSDAAAVGLETGFGDAVLNIVFIMALISVNLGIVNMFPFPALDGGRFVFLLIEAIIRRPLPRKLEYIVNGIGLALLLVLLVVITGNDIFKLVTGTFPSMQ